MPGKPDSLQNITMAGGGVYSLATRGAEDVITKSIPLVIHALIQFQFMKIRQILPSLTWEQLMEVHP